MFIIFVIAIILITIFTIIFIKTPSNSPDSNLYTTFLGSEFITLIKGELTKENVQKAESIIGTIRGVQIGTAVTSIGNIDNTTVDSPFYNQTQITSLTFKDPENSQCTTIGNYAFDGCTGLTSVIFPKSIEIIGDYAFDNCPFSSVVFNGDGVIRVITVGTDGFSAPGTLVTAISSGTLTIGADGNSYDNSNELTTFLGSDYSILISGELTKAHVQEAEAVIGTITGVQIGTAVTSIGNSSDSTSTAPFYNQTDLVTLTFKDSENSQCTIIGKSSFGQCSGLVTITLPSSVTTTYSSCFAVCTGLTSVTLSNSISSIGFGSFTGCTGLTSITLPTSATSTGSFTFSGCNGLTSVTIPDTVTTIGISCFADCTDLTSITLPDSISTVSDSAFNNCPFGVVTFNGTGSGRSVTTSANSFSEPASLVTAISGGSITVEAGGNTYVSEEYTTFVGSDYSILIVGELTKTHVQEAEAVIGAITAVQIGTLVTSIGNAGDFVGTSPFGENITLSGLTFKGTSTCTTIGAAAFGGCTALTSISLPSSVTTLNSTSFAITGLTSVTLPNTITTIPLNCFGACPSLTTITIPSSVTSIGQAAFYTTPLTSVTFNGTGSARSVSVAFLGFSSPASIAGDASISVDAGGTTYT